MKDQNCLALFEFTCKLIKSQIDKYVHLEKIGVGPDARLNSRVVYDEVNDLFRLANELFQMLKSKTPMQNQFNIIYQQIRFYVEQEYMRGYAGLLIASVGPHKQVHRRTMDQKKVLHDIALAANIDITQSAAPITKAQKQCEVESHYIAHRILDYAVRLINNPNDPLNNAEDRTIRQDIITALKKSVTRYQSLRTEIEVLHTQCEQYFKINEKPTILPFLEKDVLTYKAEHDKEFKQLLNTYKEINPASPLVSADYNGWYIVKGRPPEYQEKPQSYASQLGFYGKAAGFSLVCALVAYIASQLQYEENIFNFHPGM
jgi:hypothetical protein